MSAGKDLAAMRKKTVKTCPLCGVEYTGIAKAMACPKCAQRASYLRWKAKRINHTTEDKKMKTVLLQDQTVGVIYDDDAEVGDAVTVHLHDEN